MLSKFFRTKFSRSKPRWLSWLPALAVAAIVAGTGAPPRAEAAALPTSAARAADPGVLGSPLLQDVRYHRHYYHHRRIHRHRYYRHHYYRHPYYRHRYHHYRYYHHRYHHHYYHHHYYPHRHYYRRAYYHRPVYRGYGYARPAYGYDGRPYRPVVCHVRYGYWGPHRVCSSRW